MLTWAEWTPFQTHCYAENLAALGVEPVTSGFAARNSDHQTTQTVRNKLPLRKKRYRSTDFLSVNRTGGVDRSEHSDKPRAFSYIRPFGYLTFIDIRVIR
jgi:hypothetical protein